MPNGFGGLTHVQTGNVCSAAFKRASFTQRFAAKSTPLFGSGKRLRQMKRRGRSIASIQEMAR